LWWFYPFSSQKWASSAVKNIKTTLCKGYFLLTGCGRFQQQNINLTLNTQGKLLRLLTHLQILIICLLYIKKHKKPKLTKNLIHFIFKQAIWKSDLPKCGPYLGSALRDCKA
jgi:hypothetical protein